ncbi:hypothetical protein AgCh_028418 [Apium graveolens]
MAMALVVALADLLPKALTKDLTIVLDVTVGVVLDGHAALDVAALEPSMMLVVASVLTVAKTIASVVAVAADS